MTSAQRRSHGTRSGMASSESSAFSSFFKAGERGSAGCMSRKAWLEALEARHFQFPRRLKLVDRGQSLGRRHSPCVCRM